MMDILTTQQLFEQNLSGLESALGQKSPVNNKSFLKVLSAVLALRDTGMYKFAVERALQNLAMTATGDDLRLIGAEKKVIPKAAVATVLTVTLPAVTDVTIPITASFIGVPNGILYAINAASTSVAGVATLQLTCTQSGVAGNLQVDDLLNIVSPVAGADSAATVTEITTVGADEESENAYRNRVLFAQWATTGGGNATDHKIWAEGVAGVYRAFCYAGKPVGGGTSYPGDRTVYIEADPTVNIDGIPVEGLLDEVRAAINFDPITGKSRSVLGLVDSTLYVEAIVRTTFNLTITSLVTPSGQDATVKAAILAAVTSYFAAVAPYVEGVDLEQYRNDKITTPAVSEVVQSIINEMGSSASGVAFKAGATDYTTYTLAPNELGKLGTITYV